MVWNKQQSVTIPICVKGTPFQIAVWQIVLTVPSGETITYNSIAQQLNKPKAARAVGTAVGKNPLAYIIPCHRVVGQHGAMGGYRWGIERKKALLQWEKSSNLTLNSAKM
jgi:AraC family transcriptional regulator of adaptative response/methylated-DNA-[protein]-cysteine methyltransferase